MSTLVLCGCRDGHRPHDFTAGAFGLCQICSHGVGAHKSTNQQNAEIAERIARLLRTHEITDWSVKTRGDELELQLALRPPTTAAVSN